MGGSWIFLSHSSKDIKLVRRIRNEFESCGHNPLAFHLKCLNDSTDAGKSEIFDLLRREIDARNWFVFCESENALQSEYVRFEQEYIRSSGKDKIWSLDVTQQWDSLRESIRRISKNLRIYIRYWKQDERYAITLRNLLEQRDFTVWDQNNEHDYQGDAWIDSLEWGLVIYIISIHTCTSELLDELRYITGSINGGETLVSLFVGENYTLSPDDEGWLRSGRSFDIPENAKPADYSPLVEFVDYPYTKGILEA